MRSEIADLYRARGPFVTVYLDARSDTVHADHQLDVRWKNLKREVETEGADEATIAALEAGVAGDHTGGQTLAMVAADGKVLLRRHLPESPTADRVRLDALPWVGPLLETDQALLPHVVVLTSRTGADFYGFTATGAGVQGEVQGEHEKDEVTRVQPGGWSQRRFQQRAVNAWEDNARDVADAVVELADRLRARLVVVAGDVHAVGLLQEAMPERLRDRVRVVDGSRAVDGGIDEIVDDVRRAVDTVVAEETVAVLETFKEERGQHDRAADGPARTVEALQQAVVETLLVNDDPDDDRRAWFGPEPTMLGLDPSSLTAMGVEEPVEGRLIDVCLRAAAGTGADVRIVPAATVTDGVGAILRHTGTRPQAPG